MGETEEAVSAADAAIIVVSGKAGIEVGTRKAWELCEQYKLPRMVFVTDMDIDEASYRQVVQDLQELYGKKIAPFHLPIRENGQFVGYVNVLQQRAKRWKENGEVEKTDVPDYSKENLGSPPFSMRFPNHSNPAFVGLYISTSSLTNANVSSIPSAVSGK